VDCVEEAGVAVIARLPTNQRALLSNAVPDLPTERAHAMLLRRRSAARWSDAYRGSTIGDSLNYYFDKIGDS